MVKAEDVLKDGDHTFFETQEGAVRKGTIAATILSAKAFDELLAHPPSVERQAKVTEVIKDIRELIPGLHAAQLFQFFKPLEWFQSSGYSLSKGRALVAVLYLQEYDQLVTKEIVAKLKQLQDIAPDALRGEIAKLLKMKSVASLSRDDEF